LRPSTTWSGLAGFQPVAETSGRVSILPDLLTVAGVTGPQVPDVRVPATCLGHGVAELWTADRDFSYFPRLRTHNPLVG
jgi:hypothetical protein